MNNLNSSNRFRGLSRAIRISALGAISKSTAVLKGKQLALVVIVAAVSCGSVAAVLTAPDKVTGVVFARASFADSTDLKFKIKGQGQEVIQVNNAQETVIQQVVILPGGHTGWHSHPGPAIVLIKAGQMSFYDSDDPTCSVRTYSAGEAFIDSGQGHVHIARNEGSVNLELWVTYFDVPAGGAFRINADSAGNCGF